MLEFVLEYFPLVVDDDVAVVVFVDDHLVPDILGVVDDPLSDDDDDLSSVLSLNFSLLLFPITLNLVNLTPLLFIEEDDEVEEDGKSMLVAEDLGAEDDDDDETTRISLSFLKSSCCRVPPGG